MENIGSILKQKRIEKGLSLDQISQNTKIQSSILEHLEGGKPTDIGGSTYERMMLLTYARTLGLTEPEIDTLFKVSTTKRKIYKTEEHQNLFPKKMMFNKNSILLALLVLAVILMTLIVRGMYRKQSVSFPIGGIRSEITGSDREEPQVQETETDSTDQVSEEESDVSILLPLEPVLIDTDIINQPPLMEQETIAADDSAPAEEEDKTFLYDRDDYLATVLSLDTKRTLPLNDSNSLIRAYIVGN